MKIHHKITFTVSETEQLAFRKVGVDLQLGFRSFHIDEESSNWNEVLLLVKKFKAVDIATTTFSINEISNAKYLGVLPDWHHGYPESSDDNSYLSKTFDLSNYCGVCGVGKRQVAPFRIGKAPFWGNKSILQLNWIFDEYFVRPEVWSEIFKPEGINCRPVVLNKTGQTVDSIVQLDIPGVINLQSDGFPFTECVSCGRKKYYPITRGFYPRPDENPLLAFKSEQFFGGGASANRVVIFSKKLHKLITDAGLKGADFQPCFDK